MANYGRVYAGFQRLGLVVFLGCAVGYGLTGHVFLGFVALAGATVAVAFSVRPAGLVGALRGLGTGLAEVGLFSLLLDLVGIRVPFVGLDVAYWVALVGFLLNVVLLAFEDR